MLGTRNYPVVIGGGIAVLLFSLVGAAAITGVLPSASERKGALPEKVAKPTACRNCGVVADVRAPVSKHSPYRVVLRMDDGSERIVAQPSEPPFGVGARVRVIGQTLERG
jgi:outer membrane lipoprotein SlyB